MEYAKDGVFNIRYNTELNRLEIRKKQVNLGENTKTQDYKFYNYSSYNVFLFKFFLIYNFMKVLQNI